MSPARPDFRFTRRPLLGLLLLLAGACLAPGSLEAEDVQLNFAFIPNKYTPDQPITVRISFTTPTGATLVEIDDVLPTGWTFVAGSQDPSGATTSTVDGRVHVKWSRSIPELPTFQYAAVPHSCGPQDFAGTIKLSDDFKEIGRGSLERTVGCAVTTCCTLTCGATPSVASGSAPLAVTFTGSATATGCPTGPTYDWDFGDGSHSSQQSPVHTYAAGTFTWRLRVTSGPETCEKSGTIKVDPSGCQLSCDATASPSTGTAPLAVSLTGSATPIGCAGQPTFDWDFGDTSPHVTLSSVSHTYPWTGTYAWKLTVRSDDKTCSKTGTIQVGSSTVAPPIASPGSHVYIVSASAHAAGVPPTYWMSDMVIHNPGAQVATVAAYLLQGSRDNSNAVGKAGVVPAGQSVRLGDVVGTVFAQASAAGAILLGSDQELVVTSRTYNNASSGTYGQYIEGYPVATAVQAGESVRLLGLAKNAKYRTNIGFANAAGINIAIVTSIYRADGGLVGSRTTNLLPYGWKAENAIIDPMTAANVDDAYAVISSSSSGARFFTYASVIDQRTGDPIQVVPVGRSNGSTGQRGVLSLRAGGVEPAPPAPTATATFTPTKYTPGQPVTVQITATQDPSGTYVQVTDVLPASWTVDTSSISPAGASVVGTTTKQVQWPVRPLAGSASQVFTYRTTPPGSASGAQQFSGRVTFLSDTTQWPYQLDRLIAQASSSTYALTVTRSGTGSGTVTSSPAGISCPTTCSASFAGGTQVKLTAAAASGSTFAGWGGDCSGTGTCTLNMTQARSVTATFNLAPSYPLSVVKSGTGTGTVTSAPSGISCGATCSASFASGSSVSLTAAAGTGSTFTGWGGDCAGTGTCTMTMNQARSVTATFTLAPTCTAPAAPVMTAPTSAVSGAAYQLTWTSTSTDDTYELQESTEATFSGVASSNVTGTTATVSHASTSSTAWYSRVRAVLLCNGTKYFSVWSDAAATVVSPPAQPIYLPAGAHVTGAASTNWRTDLEVHNPGSTPAGYSVELLERDEDNSSPAAKSFTLGPGQSVRYGDVLFDAGVGFNLTGAATIRVTPTTGNVMVVSRTYNDQVSGTYGQFIPGAPASQAARYGDEVRLVQLSQSSSKATGFRTNLGLVNTTASPITVVVALYRGDGALLGEPSYNLLPYGFAQVDGIYTKVTSQNVLDGFAVVRTSTSTGAFLAYASVIDNRSGDPIYIPGRITSP